MTTMRDHWQRVYETKATDEVSWYAPHLEHSLRLVQEVASSESRFIDVGAGASTLVDDLIESGLGHLTVLDISKTALTRTARRLGPDAQLVHMIESDIVTACLPEDSFDIWHDRAVFHFLVEDEQRSAYVHQARSSVVGGGHVVLATFALSGPTRCSGLDIVQYDSDKLATELGPAFELETTFETTHQTPTGKPQRFLYCRFRRV